MRYAIQHSTHTPNKHSKSNTTMCKFKSTNILLLLVTQAVSIQAFLTLPQSSHIRIGGEASTSPSHDVSSIAWTSYLYLDTHRRGMIALSQLSATKATKTDSGINKSGYGTGTANQYSDELLSLLLQKKLKPGYKTTKEDIERIESLMQILQDKQVSFDPKECLNGPLYAVLHQSGPRPFWETYDLRLELPFSFEKEKDNDNENDDDKDQINIKGQRYTLNADGNYDVFNYAEFVGKNIYAQGVGVCQQNAPDEATQAVGGGGSNDDEKKEGNIFTNIFKSLVGNPSPKASNEVQVRCPVDYTIQVTGASISLFQNQFDFSIQGTGNLRILYCDRNLRIFTTPKDTTSTGGVIDEKSGLTVVQVRVDLIDPAFSLI